ncbi:AMED_5909 family protein [Actinophytocola oryzae]|uniref:Uncharacterized protein n=1 Tax=Actinophytocola oryzae TaxID=502181 RepID=A0A4R7V9C2_9PSEU|nr:AMED_5909 family protein [Actinophytocola oryzae]TDV45522.1 hypothetical protein CLV71_112191 [Actinophytocola oryzae]
MSVTLPHGGSAKKQPDGPTTLAEAHEVLWRQRPARDADPLMWAEFHRHSATVYAQTAAVDTRHKHETLQCAAIEIRKAQDIERRLNEGDQ